MTADEIYKEIDTIEWTISYLRKAKAALPHGPNSLRAKEMLTIDIDLLQRQGQELRKKEYDERPMMAQPFPESVEAIAGFGACQPMWLEKASKQLTADSKETVTATPSGVVVNCGNERCAYSVCGKCTKGVITLGRHSKLCMSFE
jgi:hypothetical protein